MSALVGIGDRPLDPGKQERDGLGIGSYAEALREFIGHCDTPMTVGLQGDWGSGKTSLMCLIRAGLDKQIAKVWINTWQFAQLADDQTLFLSVLQGVVDGLQGVDAELSETNKRWYSRAAALTKQALRTTARVGAAAAASHLGVDAATVMAPGDSEEVRPHTIAQELKTTLAQIVHDLAEKRERVVLFVDDLDRVPPARAVQILEALKNFLDVPGLVTVLACDYGVISRGLAARMGVSEAELGRSFFDKIIQVPFRMPVHAYQAQEYVGELLRRVGVETTVSELALATEVLRTSVGLNPRTLKRQANTLLLLLSVARYSNGDTEITKGRRPLILLGLTAMEAKFPELHRYLARVMQSDDAMAETSALLIGGHLPNRRQEPWVAQYGGEDGDGDGEVAHTALGIFLASLSALVDGDGNGVLDEGEFALLHEMMLLASVTSVAVETQPTSRARLAPDELMAVAQEQGMPELLQRLRDRLAEATAANKRIRERTTKTTFAWNIDPKLIGEEGKTWTVLTTSATTWKDAQWIDLTLQAVQSKSQPQEAREAMEALVAEHGETRDAGWRGMIARVPLRTVAGVDAFCDRLLALEPFRTALAAATGA